MSETTASWTADLARTSRKYLHAEKNFTLANIVNVTFFLPIDSPRKLNFAISVCPGTKLAETSSATESVCGKKFIMGIEFDKSSEEYRDSEVRSN